MLRIRAANMIMSAYRWGAAYRDLLSVFL